MSKPKRCIAGDVLRAPDSEEVALVGNMNELRGVCDCCTHYEEWVRIGNVFVNPQLLALFRRTEGGEQ